MPLDYMAKRSETRGRLARKTAEIDARIGARIRAARLLRGRSQTAIADELGIAFQQLQKYEKGSNRIGVGTLHLIAEILDTPVASFMDPRGSDRQKRESSVEHLTSEDVRFVMALRRITGRRVRQRLADLIATLGDAPRDG